MNTLLILLIGFSGLSYNNADMLNCAVRVTPKQKQDQTLITEKLSIGASFGITMKFCEIKDQFSTFFGGHGGLTFNHCFFLGVGGYGLLNDIEITPAPPWGVNSLELGYGGIIIEYINQPHRLVHLSFNSLIGGGSICSCDDPYYWDEDAFFIWEPGINVILNITKNVRMGIGGSYRYVSGVQMNGLQNSDLKGVSVLLTFKFGRF